MEQPYQWAKGLISYSDRTLYFSSKAMAFGRVFNIIMFAFNSKSKLTEAPDSLKLHSCSHLAFSRPLLDSRFCIENWENCYKHGWSITEWLQSGNRIYRRAIKMVLLGQAVEKWLISGTGHHFFPCSCCGRPSIWYCHLPPPHVTLCFSIGNEMSSLQRRKWIRLSFGLRFLPSYTDDSGCVCVCVCVCVCERVRVHGRAWGHFWAI